MRPISRRLLLGGSAALAVAATLAAGSPTPVLSPLEPRMIYTLS